MSFELLDQLSDDKINGYYRDIKFSPDKLCFSCSKNDPKSLFIYNMQTETSFDKQPAIRIDQGYTIYDHSWYPFLDSSNPATCVIGRVLISFIDRLSLIY